MPSNMLRGQPFFSSRQRQNVVPLVGGQRSVGDSLNGNQRSREVNRILVENEALLKRLQNRQSNYNVWSWEHERKQQVKRIKQICMYPPSISKRKRYQKRTRGMVLLDMEKRYASAGPNKQMYDMYNVSMRPPGDGSQGQMTGFASLSALQNEAGADGEGAQSQANFSNPGLLAGKADQNSMSASAIQHDNQGLPSDAALNKKMNTSSTAKAAAYDSDGALRVLSGDGEKQVSSTHGEEARDQVRALGDDGRDLGGMGVINIRGDEGGFVLDDEEAHGQEE